MSFALQSDAAHTPYLVVTGPDAGLLFLPAAATAGGVPDRTWVHLAGTLRAPKR